MIPLEFDYYRPDTVFEAAQLFARLDNYGKNPLYFGGGTEIITLARSGNIHTKAVIDLKAIPECNSLIFSGDSLIIGACVSLARIADSGLFPLLGKTCTRIADHTARGKITIGGNICGRIIYHEAILPLFLADCIVEIAGAEGLRYAPIGRVFDERLRLSRGEFIIRFSIERSYLRLPHLHIKRTRSAKIDYPLVSLAAIKVDGRIRAAFSGVCSFPFRSAEVEAYLNDKNLPYADRVRKAINTLPAPLLNNQAGSAEFRRFVLLGVLMNMLEKNEVDDV